MAFVINDSQQLTLTDNTFHLTERKKRFLEKSWAKTFADKVFPAIDEDIFSVLYSDKASRPNTPVNVIIGALVHNLFYLTQTTYACYKSPFSKSAFTCSK